jgi:hypothetical protein
MKNEKVVLVANTLLQKPGDLLRHAIIPLLWPEAYLSTPDIPDVNEIISWVKTNHPNEITVQYIVDDELMNSIGLKEFREYNNTKKYLEHTGFGNLMESIIGSGYHYTEDDKYRETKEYLRHHGFSNILDSSSDFSFWKIREVVLERAEEKGKLFVEEIKKIFKTNNIEAKTQVRVGNPILEVSKEAGKSGIILVGNNALALELKKNIFLKNQIISFEVQKPSMGELSKREISGAPSKTSIFERISHELAERSKKMDIFLEGGRVKEKATRTDGGDKE